jgi:hypothetical protein
VVAVCSILISEEPEEEEGIANADAVIAKMCLRCSRLAKCATPILEHWVVMAEIPSGQTPSGDMLDKFAES